MSDYELHIVDTVFESEPFVVEMSTEPSSKVVFIQGQSGSVVPSSDSGNTITIGSDGNLFAPEPDHLLFINLQPLP